MVEPIEVFNRVMGPLFACDAGAYADMFAKDAVVEWPFAPAGWPGRLDGRDAIRAHVGAMLARFQGSGRRFVGVRDPVVHAIGTHEVIVEFLFENRRPRGTQPAAVRALPARDRRRRDRITSRLLRAGERRHEVGRVAGRCSPHPQRASSTKDGSDLMAYTYPSREFLDVSACGLPTRSRRPHGPPAVLGRLRLQALHAVSTSPTVFTMPAPAGSDRLSSGTSCPSNGSTCI